MDRYCSVVAENNCVPGICKSGIGYCQSVAHVHHCICHAAGLQTWQRRFTRPHSNSCKGNSRKACTRYNLLFLRAPCLICHDVNLPKFLGVPLCCKTPCVHADFVCHGILALAFFRHSSTFARAANRRLWALEQKVANFACKLIQLALNDHSVSLSGFSVTCNPCISH